MIIFKIIFNIVQLVMKPTLRAGSKPDSISN